MYVDLESQTVYKYRRSNLSAIVVGQSALGLISQNTLSLIKNSVDFTLGRKRDGHTVGIKYFIDSIQNDENFLVTGEKGLNVVKVMEMLVDRLNSYKKVPC